METQIATALRQFSHEKLVRLAAKLAADLERIASERAGDPTEAADAALRNSGFAAIEDLAPSLIDEREQEAADRFYGRYSTQRQRDEDMYGERI